MRRYKLSRKAYAVLSKQAYDKAYTDIDEDEFDSSVDYQNAVNEYVEYLLTCFSVANK